MSDLATVPREKVAFILNETEGDPLHVKREKLYRWAIDLGFTGSLATEVMGVGSLYKDDLTAFKKREEKKVKVKALSDKEWKETCQKAKRWDSKHNCEIPAINSDDPHEYRFGGSGTKGSKIGNSGDRPVDWHSQP